MHATRYLFRQMPNMKNQFTSKNLVNEVTLHEHLRNKGKEIDKTTRIICKNEGIFVSGFAYPVILGVVTALEGMEYLGNKYPPIIVKNKD